MDQINNFDKINYFANVTINDIYEFINFENVYKTINYDKTKFVKGSYFLEIIKNFILKYYINLDENLINFLKEIDNKNYNDIIHILNYTNNDRYKKILIKYKITYHYNNVNNDILCFSENNFIRLIGIFNSKITKHVMDAIMLSHIYKENSLLNYIQNTIKKYNNSIIHKIETTEYLFNNITIIQKDMEVIKEQNKEFKNELEEKFNNIKKDIEKNQIGIIKIINEINLSLKSINNISDINTSVNDTSVNNTLDNTSVNNTLDNNTSINNTSDNNTSVNNTSVNNTLDNTSVNNTLDNNTSDNNTSVNNTSVNNTSDNNTIVNNTSDNNTSVNNTLDKNTLVNNTSDTSVDNTSENNIYELISSTNDRVSKFNFKTIHEKLKLNKIKEVVYDSKYLSTINSPLN